MSDAPRRIFTDDRDDERSYDTIEEAIAVAMSELEPGGILQIHAADCAQDDADQDKCTCEPMELVVGAKA